MAETGWTDKRPLSPHLQVWRWHATMYGSILHRVTGVGLYFGAILIAGWAVALASGPDVYALFEQVIFSMFGRFVLFLWTLAILYHLANGLRHLVWDGPGVGFSPGVASLWSLANFAFAILGATIIWSLASIG
jgi:succinate dehydrogenase / fumarate reductase cytochrome b subunit